jgi:hypothetical protein
MSGTLGFPRSSVILLCNPKDHYLLGIWNSRPELGSRSWECPIWGLRARAASGEDHIQEMWPGLGVKLLSVGTSDQRISKNWRHLSREDLRYFLILPWTVRDPSGPQKVCPHTAAQPRRGRMSGWTPRATQVASALQTDRTLPLAPHTQAAAS